MQGRWVTGKVKGKTPDDNPEEESGDEWEDIDQLGQDEVGDQEKESLESTAEVQ